MKFSIPTKISKVFHIFHLSWSIILYKELKNVGLFCQVTAKSKNCVTGVVERNLSQLQILKGIQDKNIVVPKDIFDYFQRWNDGLWRGIKVSVATLWQGEIFDLKVFIYLDESNSLKTQSFICLCDRQAVHKIDWYLRRTLIKDVKLCVHTLKVIG